MAIMKFGVPEYEKKFWNGIFRAIFVVEIELSYDAEMLLS